MKLHHSLTPSFVAKTLQEAGFQGKVEKSGDFVYVYSAAEGWGFHVRFFNAPPTSENDVCEAFQLWSFWPIRADDVPCLILVANSFNANFRIARAFLNTTEEKKWAEIACDHFCPEGITESTFLQIIRGFIDLRRVFYERCCEAVVASTAEEQQFLEKAFHEADENPIAH